MCSGGAPWWGVDGAEWTGCGGLQLRGSWPRTLMIIAYSYPSVPALLDGSSTTPTPQVPPAPRPASSIRSHVITIEK